MRAIQFAGSDFTLSAEELPEDLREALLACCPPGQDAEPFVDVVLGTYDITGDPEDCRAYLRGYGAWEDDELTDHQTNLSRLVWLTGCALSEGEEAYFSTY